MDNKKQIKDSNDLTEEEFLKNYKPSNYEKPSVTVDTLVFTVDSIPSDNNRKLPEKNLQILLIERKNHPYINTWALPGGFIDIDESIDDAAYRELKEETNIDNLYLEQLYTFGSPKRDPRMRVISVAYIALVNKEKLKPKAGDDALQAKWFNIIRQKITESVYLLKLENKDNCIIYEVDEYNNKVTLADYSKNSLAFDHIDEIILAINRLKNKIEYTDIAFNLVPQKFTLADIQSVYELILNKKLQRIELQRLIKNKIIDTGITSKDYCHRPAKMYRRK